ncbi:MAG: response regulator [Opitutales bacterium]|nr:response regulator [Opitutales bacterium]
MNSTNSKILIVDDSETFADMVAMVLQEYGWATKIVADADSAFKEIQETKYALLILDQCLSGEMTGEMFLEKAGDLLEHTSIVFVSGNLDVQTASRLTHLGVDLLFTKPIDPTEFLPQVMDSLKRKRKSSILLNTGQNFTEGEASGPEEDPRSQIIPSPDLPSYKPIFSLDSDDGKIFSGKIKELAERRCNCLLYGESSSPLQAVAEDFLQVSFSAGETESFDLLEDSVLRDPKSHKTNKNSFRTFFIPRVEELSQEQQSAVLDFIKNHTGSRSKNSTRVLFTSHRSPKELDQMSEEGQLNGDLFQYLDTFSLSVPPFAEFRQDYLDIAKNLLGDYCRKTNGRTSLEMCEDAVEWIETNGWTGGYEEFKCALLLAASRSSVAAIDRTSLLESQQKMAKILGLPAEDNAPGLPAEPAVKKNKPLKKEKIGSYDFNERLKRVLTH